MDLAKNFYSNSVGYRYITYVACEKGKLAQLNFGLIRPSI